jgi:hypothetical protein
MLIRLCQALGVAFLPSMLSWPPGPRPTDGVWARHWYAAVERSTGFQPWRPKNDPIPPERQAVYKACQEIYDRLAAHRLKL